MDVLFNDIYTKQLKGVEGEREENKPEDGNITVMIFTKAL